MSITLRPLHCTTWHLHNDHSAHDDGFDDIDDDGDKDGFDDVDDDGDDDGIDNDNDKYDKYKMMMVMLL